MMLWFLAIVTLSASPITTDPLPPASIAYPDGAQSVIFNPAGLGVVRGWEARGYLTSGYEDGGRGAGALAATWKGIGLGYQGRHEGPATSDIYSVSYGRRLVPGLNLGAGYHSVDGSPVWDAGILLRPSAFLSLGTRAWDAMRSPSYVFGMALHPLGFSPALEDMLTLSADYKNGRDARSWLFAASLEPVPGFVLSSSMENFDRPRDTSIFYVGLEVNFLRLGLGSFSRFVKNDGYDGQIYSARISQAQWPTVLAPRGRYLDLEISGEFPEQPAATIFPGARGLSHLDVIRALRRASQDPSVKGVLMTIKDSDMGMGKLQELRDALKDFRGKGKRVISYLEDGGTKGYYLASAGDEIVGNPVSHLDLVGLYARVLFFRGTLEKVGLTYQIEKKGKYKSFPESFTERGMSPEHREEVESLLGNMYDQMINDLSTERKAAAGDLRKNIERGIFSSDEAVKEGLVDRLQYGDEIRKNIGEGKLIDMKEYSRVLLKTRSFKAPARIAVIYISGSIAGGETRSSPLGDISGSETISAALKEAREDIRVAAVVLRVNSGGGSALASDEIRREVALTKGKKPVIVSMGDLAASGGYLVASPADAIFAEPGSLTGSIGVFGGKMSFQGLLKKLGIDVDVVRRGRHADVYSIHRGLDNEERAALEKYISFLYDGFKRTVAEGRKKTPEEVESLAQGRVWTGKQAAERGLVDGMGGLSAALDRARLVSGIRAGSEIEIVEQPGKKIQVLSLLTGMEDAQGLQGWKNLIELLISEGEKPLLIVPYWIEFGDSGY